MTILTLLLAAGTLTSGGFDREAFRNPPAEVSPAFFWMWNAKLDRDRLFADLDAMRAKGVRSVCVHPFPKEFRPGRFPTEMEPGYLTDEYMRIYAEVVRYAAAKGMNLWLYDEGGWPSGGACGKVAASAPDGRFLRRYFGYGPDGKGPLEVRALPANSTTAAEYPSVIERGTAERFLALTHGAYAKAFPEAMGKTVRFAFTDEPAIPYGMCDNLRWCADFAEVFKSRKGYDIVPHVPALIADPDGEDESLVRYRLDYNEVLSALLRERFLLPVRDWCRTHGMLSGGHLNGEDEPEMSAFYTYGSLMESLRTLDVPGVDVIWRQLFPADGPAAAKTNPFPRYAGSAAHLNGGRYALSETFGIFGNSVTPDQMKWLVDCQFVRGVNLFVFAYYAMDNGGAWMTLFEPHSGPVSPLWEMESAFFRDTARTAALLSQGRPGAETALFYDTRAFWSGRREAKLAAELQRTFAGGLERLGCDFDFVDDASLADAKVEDGRLAVGAMRYRAVVLPTSKRMGDAARAKLEAFRRAGGTVVADGDLSRVPRTCGISGADAQHFRVMKRVAGDESLYFVVNEDVNPRCATLSLPGTGRTVRADPSTGRYVAVAAEGDGSFPCELPGCGSAIFIVGAEPDDPVPMTAAGRRVTVADGWTFRRSVGHAVGKRSFEISAIDEPSAPIALGDWRGRVGATFAGRGVYSVTFDSPHEGEADLSLGKVCWCAAAKLNGEELPGRFNGPFTWRVKVRKGPNRLEVTVANLLSNAQPDEVRDRVRRDFPNGSNYERFQRPFDRLNREGGLFGPVTFRFVRPEPDYPVPQLAGALDGKCLLATPVAQLKEGYDDREVRDAEIFAAIENRLDYFEFDGDLPDVVSIQMHDAGVKTVKKYDGRPGELQAAADLGVKYLRTKDPQGVAAELKALQKRMLGSVSRAEFRIRDPYVFADPKTKTYYLYETTPWNTGRGVNVRTSKDLERWSAPTRVMTMEPIYRCRSVWAPEVHEVGGRYYMFATPTLEPDPKYPIRSMADDPGFAPPKCYALTRRGVWIWRADSPLGPFELLSDGAATPHDVVALDGTLMTDSDGTPWMVYSHCWTQTKVGRMEAARLKDDLSGFAGKPIELFRGDTACGSNHVVDGPFLYRSPVTGRLSMLWSKFVDGSYSVLCCESETGKVAGPWGNFRVVFAGDGGHGMVFRDFSGKLRLVMHRPEIRGYERLAFFPVEDTSDGLKMGK